MIQKAKIFEFEKTKCVECRVLQANVSILGLGTSKAIKKELAKKLEELKTHKANNH